MCCRGHQMVGAPPPGVPRNIQAPQHRKSDHKSWAVRTQILDSRGWCTRIVIASLILCGGVKGSHSIISTDSQSMSCPVYMVCSDTPDETLDFLTAVWCFWTKVFNGLPECPIFVSSQSLHGIYLTTPHTSRGSTGSLGRTSYWRVV